ncbi:MAG: hypothetical protein ABI318_23230 [Chthoniobacteraceae bacterium]
MNIPRFWSRATAGEFEGLGHSFTSEAEARQQAQAAAAENARRFAGSEMKHGGSTYYCDRPVREAILREFPENDGETTAMVTRNAYGSIVLNAAQALFVDVDFPEQRPASAGGFLKKLFGRTTSVPATNPHESVTLEKAAAWQRERGDWSWRVYRTKAGLRLLATHALFFPSDATPVFEALGADPLYRKLCKAQRCFRARLTPKPWRCGLYGCHLVWPWRSADHERKFGAWQEEYTAACQSWAVCELVDTIGPSVVHPDLVPLIEFHDSVARVGSGLPLA